MKTRVALSLAVVVLIVSCAPTAGPAPANGEKILDKISLASITDFPNLDPSYRASTAVANVMINIYDSLLTFDKELKLAPSLATEWKNVEPTVWEFKLRSGVTFSDGQPFNADTVKSWFARLQEIRDKALGSSSIQLIPSVTAVTATDSQTVRFVSREPDPTLPRRLATFFTYITPPLKADANPKTYWTNPVGTGPYKVKENVAGDHLTLTVNPSYWGPKPKVTDLEFRIIKDGAARASSLRSGQVDIAFDLPIGDLAAINSDPNLKVLALPEATRIYWMLLASDPGGPLTNKLVRQALNYAVDKKTIISKLLAGQAQETSSLVPRQAFGYCATPSYDYDPQRARQLLKDAGYASGFSVDISYAPGNYTSEEQVVQAIGNYLQDVGIKPNYVPKDLQGRIADLAAKKTRGLFYLGHVNSTLDADFIFGEFQPNAIAGWTQTMSGESQTLYLQERKEMNPETRAKIACDIQKLQRDEAPVLYLWQQNLIHGVRTSRIAWDMSNDGLFYSLRVTPK